MSGGQDPWVFESGGVADTLRLGAAIGRLARAGDVVALDGELGAGKTQLVRGLAEGMGLDPRDVSSPTFVFVQEYPPPPEEEQATTGGGSTWLVHVDAYRLEGPEGLASVGWGPELLADAVVTVEWASRIEGALGADRLSVRIEHAGEGLRSIEVSASGSWVERTNALRAAMVRG